MENKNAKYIVWGIRILSSALFVLSAVGKLSMDVPFDKPSFAIYNFERNFLTLGLGIDAGIAQILSRLLIAVEFSIALLLLLPFFTKKIVIPGTIVLLAAFSIHLGIQAAGGDASNCGCFGSLIEMTPLESLIKNLISIALLVLLITKFKNDWTDKANFVPLAGVAVVFSALMFLFIPLKDMDGETTGPVQIDEEHFESGYAVYFDDIDDGAKLLCFFSPTCEHCQATATELTKLKSENPDLIPDLRILFMDESGDGSETDVQNFFQIVGAEYTYKVLSVEDYIPIFFGQYNFPGVKYLYNGGEKLFFEGTEDNGFKADLLLEELNN